MDKLKKGNTWTLEGLVKDRDGVVITNLANADYIKFQLKETKDGSAIVDLSVGSGITVDSPSEGYLTIVVGYALTNDLNVMDYYIAIEILWGDNKQEAFLYDENDNEFDTITVVDHIIRAS